MRHFLKRAILATVMFCMSYGIVNAEPIILKYDGQAHTYNLPPISLYINNKSIKTTVMPPILLNDSVLVPAREVFEPMGASVEWKPSERKVYIYDQTTLLVLEVDKNEAFVNGDIKTLNVPPKIINDKVMIPMRFIGEQLGFKVVWQGGTERSVMIEKIVEAALPPAVIPPVEGTPTTGEVPQVPDENTLPALDPVVTPVPDWENTLNHVDYIYEEGTLILEKPEGLSIGNITVTDLYRERKLVVSLNGDYSKFFDGGSLSGKAGKIKNVSIDHTNGTQLIINTFAIQAVNLLEEDGKIRIQLVKPSEKYEKIVVIDAGHGGSDPGTSGGGIKEKDLNILFALDTYKLLLNNPDIKVYMTRETDVYPSLQERVNISNEIDADLFISIHNNYIDKTTVNGTETFYYGQSADTRGQEFAKLVQANIVQEFNMTDRKAKSSGFFVIKNTTMPAVLIEVGFLSSAKDRQTLTQPDFSGRLGVIIYNSVLSYFDTYGS